MKIFVGIVILIIIVFAVFSKIKKKNDNNFIISESGTDNLKPMIFSSEPDLPKGFGYKCQWFAIKTEDTKEVLKELNLKNVQISNWETGIEGACEGYFFISPPVNGWTFVINSTMPGLSINESPFALKIITDFSTKFGEAYYFGTHRVVEYHAWAKAVDGELIHAFGYLGERGEIIINEGEISREEIEHNLIFTDLDADEPNLPSEEDVILIAREWCIDPKLEDDNYIPGTGFIGNLE
ncbi:hypothetical protein J2Z22_004839 [Paenibacillus forsythiae]|uniref:Uncharacterized protein n=1 Tax=Paenibacillus forsythiae TaxID=365616 RepID=A0ABU3HEJ7_9BACL|nr:hypothetical protein [Paenibacillus forsythiae]MDT3429238.1 hypothetical protein [Paenibacillus forsythiae]